MSGRGEEKGNCTYIPANMAGEVAKLIVGNDSGMCKASFAGDVPRMFSLIKHERWRDEIEKRETCEERERFEKRQR